MEVVLHILQQVHLLPQALLLVKEHQVQIPLVKERQVQVVLVIPQELLQVFLNRKDGQHQLVVAQLILHQATPVSQLALPPLQQAELQQVSLNQKDGLLLLAVVQPIPLQAILL